MNIQWEKNCKISSQDRYDIIGRAIDAAEDDGYLSQFVFERALYVFLANNLYPEQEIDKQVLESSPMVVWDQLLEDGVIDLMLEEYREEADSLADNALVWFNDYQEYCNSMRGLANVIESFTAGMANSMGQQLDSFKNDKDIASVYDIAEKWGLNNDGSQILGESN